MIKCNQVHKSFEDIKAVDGVDFVVKDGTFLGLLGPNGAGKTTLIKTMIGLLDPTEGSVSFDGVEIGKDAIEVKRNIGVVSQHVNLDKELTVEENMYFSGKLYQMKKSDIKERTDYLLDLLGLTSVRKRISKRLSGGMKRKLMIAKALIHNPQYIFLDEPTVGIDVNARKEIWQFLRKHHKLGKTIILTTHYIEEAEALCDYVMLISKGKIFKENKSEMLIKELGNYRVEYSSRTKSVFKFYKTLDEAKESVRDLNEIYNISKTTLEDVFFYYTNQKVHIWK